jgi:hypothetical protein
MGDEAGPRALRCGNRGGKNEGCRPGGGEGPRTQRTAATFVTTIRPKIAMRGRIAMLRFAA